MLQRSLPAVLQWAPALSARCLLQQTAGQIATAGSFNQSFISSSSSSSSISNNTSAESVPSESGRQRHAYSFSSRVVDVSQTLPQPRRAKLPYFNPDDGPEAYQYWKDLWAKPRPRPKIKRVRKEPLYLEAEEQQALIEAAVGAGVPLDIVEGDMSVRQVPRLIAAILAKRGRIPADPQALADRIGQLLQLGREVPGLDMLRIFKAKGFGILAEPPEAVQFKLKFLANRLAAAGVAAEPGVLMTAAVKPALCYPAGLVDRLQQLPAVFKSSLGVRTPRWLRRHPFGANVLNRSTRAVQADVEEVARRQGKATAAAMYKRLPQLLLMRSQTLSHKTTALAGALDLEPHQVNNLVKRHPRLLTYSAETLTNRVEGLGHLLGLSSGQQQQQQLQQVVLRWPSLLYKRTETIANKLSVIQQQLGLPSMQAAADALQQCPMLASHSSARLQQPLQQLQGLQDTSILAPLKPNAQAILRAKPHLLTLGSDGSRSVYSITGRLRLLEQLAQLGGSWKEVVTNWVNSSSRDDLAAVLGHKGLVARVQWLLVQQQQHQQRESVGSTAVAAAADDVGLYGLVVMREARFEKRFPGFAAHQQQQKKKGPVQL